MAKINELVRYLNHTFSTGCYTGEDYKKFQTTYISYLRSMCKENSWELAKVGRSHYEFSVFVKNGGAYLYVSISDVRFFKNEWFYKILIRDAESDRDCRGGMNRYTTLPQLAETADAMFRRREQRESTKQAS